MVGLLAHQLEGRRWEAGPESVMSLEKVVSSLPGFSQSLGQFWAQGPRLLHMSGDLSPLTPLVSAIEIPSAVHEGSCPSKFLLRMKPYLEGGLMGSNQGQTRS